MKKNELLAALQPRTETIDVADFGPLQVRQLTVGQADAARKHTKDNPGADPSDFGLRLLAMAVVDDTGAPLFDDADLPALRNAGGSAVDRLVAEVLRINGFTTQAEGPNA